MGWLKPDCIVQNGTRMVGMAYTSRMGRANNNSTDTHVLLIQSNPSPSNINSVTWKLAASYERLIQGPQDYTSTLTCHTDPETGVFAMISMFEGSDGYPVPAGVNDPPKRKPGGFLFEASLGRWLDFTLSADYRWGDSYLKPNSFVLFRPHIIDKTMIGTSPLPAGSPSPQPTKTANSTIATPTPTSTPTISTSKPLPHSALFFHANIGSGSSVNIGLLPNDGTYKMINWEQWELDPQIFGFPVLLAFAKKSLFQLGTKIDDSRTGNRKFYLTRIPIRDNFMFSPTNNYSVIPLPEFECDVDSMMAKPYQDSLYIVCLRYPSRMVAVKDEDNAVPEVGSTCHSDTLNLFQPIGGDLPGQEPFMYCPVRDTVIGCSLDLPQYYQDLAPNQKFPISITEKFGYEYIEWNPNSVEVRTDLIVGCVLLGVLLIAAAILYRPIRRRWPRWKARWRQSLLEQISSDDEFQDNHGNENSMEMKKKRSPKVDPKSIDKIEIPSGDNSNEFEGQDKILVTCDEDLVGALNLMQPMVPQKDNTSDRYMGDLNLDHHPRPVVATSHAQDDVEAGLTSSSLHKSPSSKTRASGKEQLTRLLSPLPSNYTPSALPSAPPAIPSEPLNGQIIPPRWESTDITSSSASTNTEYTLPDKEDIGASWHKKDEKRQIAEDVDEEDRVPPYVKQFIIPILPPTASHLEQHLPSAPSLAAIESEVSTAKLGPPPSLPSTVPSPDSISEQITRIVTLQGQEQAQEQEQELTNPNVVTHR
ncbi:hypothetical protein BGW38_004166 [Lunasporangiospora selenospora]|uniref:Uncharacterized protein n=1 Tax=Lunasporangiospora selenospora TaxID=979761 RepID=A0A9P6G030_9FUNG|nr:hypothetical protein BGW38_004166 [Lunasporangiospora selenospora]